MKHLLADITVDETALNSYTEEFADLLSKRVPTIGSGGSGGNGSGGEMKLQMNLINSASSNDLREDMHQQKPTGPRRNGRLSTRPRPPPGFGGPPSPSPHSASKVVNF